MLISAKYIGIKAMGKVENDEFRFGVAISESIDLINDTVHALSIASSPPATTSYTAPTIMACCPMSPSNHRTDIKSASSVVELTGYVLSLRLRVLRVR